MTDSRNDKRERMVREALTARQDAHDAALRIQENGGHDQATGTILNALRLLDFAVVSLERALTASHVAPVSDLMAEFKKNMAASEADLKEKLKPYEDGERASRGIQSSTASKLPFMARMALVGARDYLLWLVELKGIKAGAVGSVREAIDRAIAEDDAAPVTASATRERNEP